MNVVNDYQQITQATTERETSKAANNMNNDQNIIESSVIQSKEDFAVRKTMSDRRLSPKFVKFKCINKSEAKLKPRIQKAQTSLSSTVSQKLIIIDNSKHEGSPCKPDPVSIDLVNSTKRYGKSKTYQDFKPKPMKKSKSNNITSKMRLLQFKNRIQYLWRIFRNLMKMVSFFLKLNRTIKLYGNSKEIYNADKPKLLEKQLKRIGAYYSKSEASYFVNNKASLHPVVAKFPVIHPESNLIRCWNYYLFVLIIYSAIITPYYLAFEGGSSTKFGFQSLIEILIDFSFITEVLLCFNTAFFKSNKEEDTEVLINSRGEIFNNYIRGWFTLDLITSIPLSLLIFFPMSEGRSNAVRSFKFVRLIKLVKFHHKFAYSRLISQIINHDTYKILLFLITAVLLSHIFACFWFLFPRMYDESENWVNQLGFTDRATFELYLLSFYYSISTLFTIGFGDIYSFSTVEHLLTIIWMLFGVGFYSFTIGTLSSFLVEMNSKETKLKYKLSLLNDLSREIGLDGSIKEKIKSTLINTSDGISSFSWAQKQALFTGLPITLKVEVSPIIIQLDCQIFKAKLLERNTILSGQG